MNGELNWYCSGSCLLDCPAQLKRSLFLVGHIGGNEINFGLSQGKTMEELRRMVPDIVQTIIHGVKVSLICCYLFYFMIVMYYFYLAEICFLMINYYYFLESHWFWRYSNFSSRKFPKRLWSSFPNAIHDQQLSCLRWVPLFERLK